MCVKDSLLRCYACYLCYCNSGLLHLFLVIEFLFNFLVVAIVPTDVLRADDPSELSNHVTAPGILKIFGNEICEGAHYKSVLATTDSSAKELVKEALER